MKITINKTEEINVRLDKVLVNYFADKSRSYVAKLIEDNLVFVNGKAEKASYKTRANDEIEVKDIIEKESDIKGSNIPLNIIYEDDDILIIDKPQGLVVHPGAGHHDDTIVNALTYLHKHLSSCNGSERPGIVHRIDKDTSGLLCIAKNDNAHRYLAKQLEDHSMHREYYALVEGIIEEDDGKIIAPIKRDNNNKEKMKVNVREGKEAITYFHVIKRYKDTTFISLQLLTGRTHQIRCHMEYIGHPVVGDPVYGKNNQKYYSNGQLLHAYELTFVHPTTKKEVTFTSPLPSYFKDVLDKLD